MSMIPTKTGAAAAVGQAAAGLAPRADALERDAADRDQRLAARAAEHKLDQAAARWHSKREFRNASRSVTPGSETPADCGNQLCADAYCARESRMPMPMAAAALQYPRSRMAAMRARERFDPIAWRSRSASSGVNRRSAARRRTGSRSLRTGRPRSTSR